MNLNRNEKILLAFAISMIAFAVLMLLGCETIDQTDVPTAGMTRAEKIQHYGCEPYDRSEDGCIIWRCQKKVAVYDCGIFDDIDQNSSELIGKPIHGEGGNEQ